MVLSGGSVGGSRTEWHAGWKLHWVLLAMNGYSLYLSAASVVAVALLLYALHRQRLIALSAPGQWIGAGFLLLFLALPFRLLDTSFVDVRIVIAAVFVLPAFITIEMPDLRWAYALTAIVAVIVVANVALVAHVWLDYQSEYMAFKRSFALLERGSRVLVGHSGIAPDPPPDLTEYPAYHAPTLAVHYAGALVPTLFTYPGKQPVEVVPAFRHLSVPQGGPAPVLLLKLLEGRGKATVPSFLRNWDYEFNYLYVLGPRIANPMPEILDEMARANRFTLYRIKQRSMLGVAGRPTFAHFCPTCLRGSESER
jgi:hypothetical protein